MNKSGTVAWEAVPLSSVPQRWTDTKCSFIINKIRDFWQTLYPHTLTYTKHYGIQARLEHILRLNVTRPLLSMHQYLRHAIPTFLTALLLYSILRLLSLGLNEMSSFYSNFTNSFQSWKDLDSLFQRFHIYQAASLTEWLACTTKILGTSIFF